MATTLFKDSFSVSFLLCFGLGGAHVVNAPLYICITLWFCVEDQEFSLLSHAIRSRFCYKLSFDEFYHHDAGWKILKFEFCNLQSFLALKKSLSNNSY